MDMLGTYIKSIRQHKMGGDIIKNNVCLAFMPIIEPTTGWVEIVEVPTFNLDDVTGGNDDYIDRSSSRLSKLFNDTWLSRYPQKTDLSLKDKPIL